MIDTIPENPVRTVTFALTIKAKEYFVTVNRDDLEPHLQDRTYRIKANGFVDAATRACRLCSALTERHCANITLIQIRTSY